MTAPASRTPLLLAVSALLLIALIGGLFAFLSGRDAHPAPRPQPPAKPAATPAPTAVALPDSPPKLGAADANWTDLRKLDILVHQIHPLKEKGEMAAVRELMPSFRVATSRVLALEAPPVAGADSAWIQRRLDDLAARLPTLVAAEEGSDDAALASAIGETLPVIEIIMSAADPQHLPLINKVVPEALPEGFLSTIQGNIDQSVGASGS